MLKKIMKVALIGMLITSAIIGSIYYFAHNKSYQNEAISRADYIILNGVEYEVGAPNTEYNITNVLICTTDDGRKIYEIKEYPDYEYIAVYSHWDGNLYKKVGD